MSATVFSSKGANWIGSSSYSESPIFLRKFDVQEEINKATLTLTGLGYFEAQINSSPVCEDKFIPVVSDYEARPLDKFLYPLHDETTHAIYYYEYNITHLIQKGANELSIQLGNGFYRQMERNVEGPVHFGDTLKTIYVLEITTASGTTTFVSDGSETWKSSEITYSNLFLGEVISPTVKEDAQPVHLLPAPDTELRRAIGTPDRVIRTITPTFLGRSGNKAVFDAGENISGIVRIYTSAPSGEKITLQFAETLDDNLALNFSSTGAEYICSSGKPQIMTDVFVADGTSRTYEPKFVWHTFRYFDIEGDFKRAEVLVIHADTPVTASFESPSEGLSFLWDAYLRTQLNNMHGSIPSDCPHRERLGYTGDGQVCAPAAMMLMDCKAFYRKWIQDILDCQDKKGGHVQHTAPLMGGGGGPGGWGCAIITVPYAFYKQYGDTDIITHCYAPMQHWIKYLQEHSENNLVTKEEKDGWCLGDWLTLEKITLPEAFVNTCYTIKSLHMLAEMATVISKNADADYYNCLAETYTAAVRENYLDKQTHRYCNGIQGADAYAVWAGLVKEEELEEHMTVLAAQYDTKGHFDTGFLGTDILAEVLMDHGYSDVLLKLFESEDVGSFLHMKRNGATTIWEDWKGTMSGCHPMFGAASRQLFTGFLGIRQENGFAGYERISISPRIPSGLSYARGSLTTPKGNIRVSWQKKGSDIVFDIQIPEGVEATFTYQTTSCRLVSGQNRITCNN